MTTVLVVDDEPMVRDVVTRYLERDGHRVLTAEDGDGARRIIEREAPGLVLLDVMLPGTSDGLELCRWIRASSELPVILLTARVEEADRIVGLELGADNYMTKPFSPRELATRVKTVLRRARASRPPPSASRSGRWRWTPPSARRGATASFSPSPPRSSTCSGSSPRTRTVSSRATS